MIFHIIKKDEWQRAQKNGYYEPDSLKTDGFIHCCDSSQVTERVETMNGRKELLLLEIDEALVKADIVYEDLYELNQLYPHIYGNLNLDAVVEVRPLKRKNCRDQRQSYR